MSETSTPAAEATTTAATIEAATPTKTTPTGIPFVMCGSCRLPHPITRKHCQTCGSPSVFAHKTHARRTAHVNYLTGVSDAYQRPRSTAPAVTISILSHADAVHAACAVYEAEHGMAPLDHVSSDRNGVVTVEAYGPHYMPAVSVTWRP
ncbi:hypothetical protein [Kineococcus sp. SYSU DK003]|uniref:hypothetical protein n=1 Tax=Kineococcus sp. SYSU DK003 TaxID=3383124 RepID=UPI003D7D39F9